jgi:hypothetical protein
VEAAGKASRAFCLAVLVVGAMSCGKRNQAAGRDASTGAASAAPPPASIAAAPSNSVKVAAAAPATSAVVSGDGGVASCKITGGPTLEPFNGPALLRIAARGGADVAELVFNEGGSPRVYDARVGDTGPRGPAPAKSTIPACAAAEGFYFCPDAGGAIHKSRGTGEDDVVVARSKPGTDVAAASLGGRPLVAYIADRVTSEGLVREGWIAMEGSAPVRFSEDGSGATCVDLAPRGKGLLAMTIDARVAMTPTHARVLTLAEGKLQLGNDAVIFVGGSAERRNAGTIATTADGTAFALVPVSEDAIRFGMAAVRLDDPPTDDSNVVWSFYPNGLDPAPVAATRGNAQMHVARVRPKTAQADAPHVLEIGVLEPNGAFRPSCIAAESTFVRDIEIARDRQNALWVFYRTPGGSWLLRLPAV